MKHWITRLLLFYCVLPVTVPAQSCSTLDAIDWLLGNWVIESEAKTMRENWHRAGPITFEGVNETRNRETGELRSRETMRLLDMSGGIFFLAKVSENEYPVPFKLTMCTKQQAVFENPNHDFPRKLDYSLKDTDRLDVHVSDGADEGFTLNFSRLR